MWDGGGGRGEVSAGYEIEYHDSESLVAGKKVCENMELDNLNPSRLFGFTQTPAQEPCFLYLSSQPAQQMRAD